MGNIHFPQDPLNVIVAVVTQLWVRAILLFLALWIGASVGSCFELPDQLLTFFPGDCLLSVGAILIVVIALIRCESVGSVILCLVFAVGLAFWLAATIATVMARA